MIKKKSGLQREKIDLGFLHRDADINLSLLGDTDINLSLPDDAFNLVVRAKTALERACPNTVSYADILFAATRDLLTMLGCPFYPIFLRRHDDRFSSTASVPNHLPLHPCQCPKSRKSSPVTASPWRSSSL
ncbi:hypothetical protein VIGAN_11192300 [Vigna angularis var. angularis]|uniref:peroxidase n=1 Tax=Vigna angularis var. angularis TaxID=157739 RepID=A0A0S3TBP8_PHAAN|nr:hypothetical protein VIGAN_11192300 [Vigna angularis var. angularis]